MAQLLPVMMGIYSISLIPCYIGSELTRNDEQLLKMFNCASTVSL
jgi:hypothetical protein